VFGDAHPRSVKAINNPPGIYLAKRDFATAEHLLQQASAITRTAFGDGHPETALSLDNAALLVLALWPSPAPRVRAFQPDARCNRLNPVRAATSCIRGHPRVYRGNPRHPWEGSHSGDVLPGRAATRIDRGEGDGGRIDTTCILDTPDRRSRPRRAPQLFAPDNGSAGSIAASEVLSTHALLTAISGEPPRFFRPPYGARNTALLDHVTALHMRIM
jgi:hypothetical protein